MKELRILHTSDWHIGHQLYKRRRDEEFIAFMRWLESIIREKRVDMLVVAGDLFDSSTPGPIAQKLYYDFLDAAAKAGVRHIVITAGNHDSPALLSASAAVLEKLHIYVSGAVESDPANTARVLYDENGEPELILCAVPYIRERDARESAPGESREDKEKNLLAGIRAYYEKLAQQAAALAAQFGPNIPILATGHLYASGASPTEEERDLYIGALGQVPAEIFAELFDYVALGHLHRSQIVGQRENIRYSGSPLPLSFGEAGQEKSAILVSFYGRQKTIEHLQVPTFRKLAQIRGNRNAILTKLAGLRQLYANYSQPVWLEIQHDGSDAPTDLRDLVTALVADTPLEILCLKTDYRLPNMPLHEMDMGLEDLSPEEIFARRLGDHHLEDDEKRELTDSFLELLDEYRLLESQDGE